MFYLVKSPWWLKAIYPECTWEMPRGNKKIYLTFDDGPHDEATAFVLDELAKYQAKATFFCIGNNVKSEPDLYNRIIAEGHVTANHTYDHLNGWNTGDPKYIDNINSASAVIKSYLFRPPYGRIKKSQLKKIIAAPHNMKAIMWTVLSGDFDTRISTQKCLNNVLNNAGDGSIIVFHDSEKAFTNLRYALPKTLDHYSSQGYTFASIS